MQFTYTAQEAYDASLNNYEEQLEKNRIELDSLIKAAIQRGEFSVIYDKQTAIDATKEMLTQLGYKVTEKIISEEKKIWVISWETAKDISDPDSTGD